MKPLSLPARALSLLILASLVLAACTTVAPTAEPSTAITVTDALGRTVTLPQPPGRIVLAGRGVSLIADSVYLFPNAASLVAAVSNTSQGTGEPFLAAVDPDFPAKVQFETTVGAEQVAAARPDLAQAVVRAVRRFSPGLILVGLAGSALIQAGREAGLRVASEGFPERGYNPDGSLRSRRLPGAVIESPAEAAQNAVRLAVEGISIEEDGAARRLPVDTLCVHGDNPNAVAIVTAIRRALADAGVGLAAL